MIEIGVMAILNQEQEKLKTFFLTYQHLSSVQFQTLIAVIAALCLKNRLLKLLARSTALCHL